MADPLDVMFQQWGGGYESTGTPEEEIISSIAEETPEERARRFQLGAGQTGPMQGPGIGSEKTLGAPDNPVGQLLENAAVGIQDLIDNTFQGNQVTPQQIRSSRRGRVMEGIQQFKEGQDKVRASDPILNSEPARVIQGGVLQAAENLANFGDLVGDSLKPRNESLIRQVFPSLVGPLNPKDDVFSSKYERANYDFGSSQMAQTPIGKVAQGFLSFGITLFATGGFKGDSGIIGATQALRAGKGAAGAAKAFGTSGAVRGALADLIDSPENGNLSNLIRDNAPEWYPTWLTALAVERGENPWLSRLKTAFEGMGLSEVADSMVGVVKGVNAAKAAKKAGQSADQALETAVQTAQQVMAEMPAPTRFVDVATTPQNSQYFTLGERQVDQLHPNAIDQIGKVLRGETQNQLDQIFLDQAESIRQFLADPGDLPEAIKADQLRQNQEVLAGLEQRIQQSQRPIGFAVNPVTGEVPTTGYQVAIDGSARLKSLDPEELSNFLIDEAEALSRDDVFIGGYIDEISGEPVIELSRNVQDINEAIRLAKEFDQISVYDIGNNAYISTGGIDQLRLTRNDGFQDVNARATTTVKPAAKQEPVELPDTRGQGQFFHGAASEINQLNEGYYQNTNIYGQGFYTTDDLKTAGSYTKKNTRSVAKEGGNPEQVIYNIKELTPVKLYDLDTSIAPSVKSYLESAADWSESTALALNELDLNPNISLAKLMDEIRANSRSVEESRDTIQEVFDGIQETLVKDGYGGFTHVGGKLQGKGERLHQVRIYWDAPNQLSLEKFDAAGLKIEDKRPIPTHRFGDIQRIAAQQAAGASTATTFAPRGGSDGILTDAAHRLIGATQDGDKLISDIAKSDPDLQRLAAETGRSINELRQEAQQIISDFTGDVEAMPGFNDMDGRKILSDPAVVAVKTLIQDTANQISESAYGVLKVQEADMDMLPQVQRMVDQLKSLLRAHKFTSMHYGRGLANFKVPALGIEIPNYFKKPSEQEVVAAMKDSDKFLDDLVKKLGSGDRQAMEEATRLANALMLANGDPARIRRFGQWAMAIAGRDGLSVMYNSMLSGPPTHIVNTLSNMFNSVYRPASAVLGSFFTQNGYIHRKAAAAAFASFHETIRESWEIAGRVMMNDGMALNDGGKGFVRASEANAQIELLHRAAEQTNDDAFKAGVGFVDLMHSIATNPILDFPSKFLTAQDEFFKTMVARMEWRSKSMIEAIEASSRSLNSVDDEFKNILKANAEQWFVLEGGNKGSIKDDSLLSSAKDVTFQTELEGMARSFASMVEAIPPLRIFFPFVKTGHNILAYAYSHLPVLGSKLPEFQKAMASQDEYLKAVMKGRQAFGSMIIGTAALTAMSGNLTGNGPSDPEERRLWLMNNKPRSVRIPGTDRWFDYSRIEPFNMILSAVADVHYGLSYGLMRERDAEYLMGHLMYTISANLTQRSYFAGLVPLGQILTPGYQGLNQLSKIPADAINNFIPLSGLRRTLANGLTPYMQEFDGELNRILYQASGSMIRGANAPRYSWLTGEPITSPSGGGGAVWPYKIQQRKSDLVLDELENIGYESSDIIRRSGVELSPIMKSQVQKAMGQSDLKKNLEALFKSKMYKDAKADAKRQLDEGSRMTKRNFWYYKQIENRIDEARDNAIRMLYANNEQFRREADSTKSDKIRARMAPEAPAPDTSFLDQLVNLPK